MHLAFAKNWEKICMSYNKALSMKLLIDFRNVNENNNTWFFVEDYPSYAIR